MSNVKFPERYCCNGPEGTFWTNSANLANKLIEAAFDRDDWTVTDVGEDCVVDIPDLLAELNATIEQRDFLSQEVLRLEAELLENW